MVKKSVWIGILIVLVIGVFGFSFVNGILEFNQENLEKSIQKISVSIPDEIIDDITNVIPEIKISEFEEKEPSGSYIETSPNKIKVGRSTDGSLYGEITPYNLKVIEKSRYDQIKFSIQAAIIDLGFDESVNLDIPGTFLIGENSKKYTINLRDCVSLGLFNYLIDGKKTDTKSFDVCYDVDNDVKKFDIMFKGLIAIENPNNTVKIGTIHIKN